MDYSEFLGQVQHRLELDSQGEAERVTRVTLETLGERLEPGEADDLAAQLPEEIGHHLTTHEGPESFGWGGFVDRLMERGERRPDERADVVYEAQVVTALVAESVTVGELDDVVGQLPEEFGDLFEQVAEGDMPV